MKPEPTRRPQLTLDELHQLKWLLGGVLTLLAVWTVFYMDVEAWTLMTVTTAATLATLIWPTLPARLPRFAHTLAFPVMVAIFIGDLWLRSEVLPAIVRLDMLLLLYRNLTYRQRRDDLQIIVLGLFLIVVAGVLTVSLIFAGQLLIYTACALGFLFVITLTESADGGAKQAPDEDAKWIPPPWAVHANWRHLLRRLRAVADWRVMGLGAVLFAGVIAVSALLFLAIPRFQLENSMFLDRFISKKARTGFSDTIRFGDVTEIQQDMGIALSVDVTDQTQIPASPYWRMLVLDDYRDGAFRLSIPLRNQAFGPERTGAQLRGEARPRLGAAVYWTFYLESGVSRYLPLLGPFESLRFREPQNFRWSPGLNALALREEPVTMTAYRVESFTGSELLADPAFTKLWRERQLGVTGRNLSQVRTIEADRARLTQLVREITEPGTPAGTEAKRSAADFAQRASTWLRTRHGYSLTPTIPSGEGDPLVRWAASREAGHCELFAGSFVLLARTAGFPARVITGFKGGSWNGYSNNFTIRNSDAHAWAEIFDAPAGGWLRADPLEVAGAAQAQNDQGAAAFARRLDRSWAARLDSLRVFWYRRIVNFDQRSQVETLKAVKDATEQSGRRLREALARAVATVKEWVTGSWDVRRTVKTGSLVLLVAGIIWVAREFGWSWWRGLLRRATGRHENPVRREAGRWLEKITVDQAGAPGAGQVRADLQRLRFGAPGTWPEPERVFRQARQVSRTARRQPPANAER